MKNHLPFNPPLLDKYMDACWIEGFFSPEEVLAMSEIFEMQQTRNATVTGEKQDLPELRKSTVTFYEPSDERYLPLTTKLGQLAIQVNADRYRFDLMGFYEDIQIAEYGEGDFFDWHTDFSAGLSSTRKLSLSVQLSEPDAYEGGDLQFMINQNEVCAPKTPGTVVIFPSYVLHRVTPITSGKRRSMVGWVTGVPFR